ncbi:MAG: Fic family protein, partial [Bacteroidota bacterium]
QGVRGMRKEPGEFRRSQNWWGGTNPQNAAFVPPPPHEIPRLMGDLEKLANDEYNPLPELLRIALIHYQFETIHPFQDGNGRIGRLMVPLYLLSQGIIRQPVLYLSAYLERHRLLYYDKLTYVRERGDLLGWYLFFLDGIIETAKDGVMTFQRIIALEKALPKRLGTLGSRAAKAQLILQELFRNPIIDAASVQRVIGSTHRTAYRLLADLEDLNILKQIPSAGRARLYAFQDYLDLFS